MNREVLFRGLTKDGKWEYGDLIRVALHSFIVLGRISVVSANDGITPKQERLGFNEWHEVLPDTVGLYTGLKDKNGKMIFEGDKVVSRNLKEWIVKFGQYHYTTDDYPNYGWYLESRNCQFPLIVTQNDKVIGNIYEDTKDE